MSDIFDHYEDAMMSLEDDYDDDYPRFITCRICGTKSLFQWQKTARGWRLFEPTGEEHVCRNRGATSLIRSLLHAT